MASVTVQQTGILQVDVGVQLILAAISAVVAVITFAVLLNALNPPAVASA